MRPNWGYLRIGVETDIAWPTEDKIVEFGGRHITLTPESDELLPSIMVRYDEDFPKDAAYRLLCEFASSVAWSEGIGVKLSAVSDCTSPRLMIGRPPLRRGRIGAGSFEELPSPLDKQTKLAMALFREALTVNLIPYQFLAYCRIINLKAGSKTKEQVDWINSEIQRVTDTNASRRLAQLSLDGVTDIGKYIYERGRCAIAHASLSKVTIDPDTPADSVRLHCDLPIVRALAERIIDNQLGISTTDTLRGSIVPVGAAVGS